MTLKLAPINHRWQLADLLNSRGLTGEAVEVGTHRGEFANAFLRTWTAGRLWCIDPWVNPPGYEEQAALLTGGGRDREEDYKLTLRSVGEWMKSGRCKLLRTMSPKAAEHFNPLSLDLVYLDADHSQMAVWIDLNAWWPKVRPGGILAGHDFICPGEGDGSPDGWGGCIQPAVLDFADYNDLDIRLIPEFGKETAGQPWSFYLEKP